MNERGQRAPRESAVEARYLVMPNQTNHRAIAFGGVIMSWIDLVAAMVGERHCRKDVVTVSIDNIHFVTPIYVGDHILLQGAVNYVGRTSMEIGVRVTRENPQTGESMKATSAHITFVALDENGKPVEIPDLLLETDEERERHRRAEIRYAARKELREKLSAR